MPVWSDARSELLDARVQSSDATLMDDYLGKVVLGAFFFFFPCPFFGGRGNRI